MDKPPAHPEHESSEDRFQHDIEELEGGGFKSFVKGAVIVVLALGVVAALYFAAGKKAPPPRVSSKGTLIIETVEPAQGKLDAAPTRFRWESISGRSNYMFRLVQKGNPKVLVERAVRDNSLQLTAEEAAQLVPGSSYIWDVEARGADGKPIGSGRSYFDL